MNTTDSTSSAPFRTMRSWLRHLAETDRLAIIRENTPLEHKLAAIAKRLDGVKATFFPKPGGHAIPVVSGMISARSWIAEAMGITESGLLAAYRHAAENPVH